MTKRKRIQELEKENSELRINNTGIQLILWRDGDVVYHRANLNMYNIYDIYNMKTGDGIYYSEAEGVGDVMVNESVVGLHFTITEIQIEPRLINIITEDNHKPRQDFLNGSNGNDGHSILKHYKNK